MGRKNNRADTYEPLDLTFVESAPRPTPGPYDRRREADEYRARVERQRKARINNGIDWSVCLVPGCGEELRWYGRLQHEDAKWRDHTTSLPLCTKHLGVAFNQAKFSAGQDHPVMVDAVAQVIQRQQEKQVAEAEARRKAHLSRKDGHIYTIRLNGLIKVGWSRDVHQRLHDYGPDVQVLCVYEGTRDDETYLHRQLKPARARGREWYEDGPILADFVAKAIEQHGEPEVRDYWSRPAAPAPRTHRSSRRRAGP